MDTNEPVARSDAIDIPGNNKVAADVTQRKKEVAPRSGPITIVCADVPEEEAEVISTKDRRISTSGCSFGVGSLPDQRKFQLSGLLGSLSFACKHRSRSAPPSGLVTKRGSGCHSNLNLNKVSPATTTSHDNSRQRSCIFQFGSDQGASNAGQHTGTSASSDAAHSPTQQGDVSAASQDDSDSLFRLEI